MVTAADDAKQIVVVAEAPADFVDLVGVVAVAAAAADAKQIVVVAEAAADFADFVGVLAAVAAAGLIVAAVDADVTESIWPLKEG